MLGGMLRFSDSFNSYYDRRIVVVGAALFMSPPFIGCGCPTLPQFLGFMFINLRISNQVTIFTLFLGKLPILSTCTRDVLSFSKERTSAF